MARVLFVDDDVNLLQGLRRQMRRQRPAWDVTTAVTGAEALDIAAKTAFDVVVTDMRMPGLSGLDVVRALNAHEPAPACIVLTGTADLETAAEIINTTKVSRFYTKPCPIDRLIDGIEAALQRKTSFVPSKPNWETQALDRLATAILVVDAKGYVVHLNQAAAVLIAQKDGVYIDHSGLFRASTAMETKTFLDQIATLGQIEKEAHHSTAVTLSRASGKSDLAVVMTSTHGGENSNEPNDEAHILVFIADPENPPALNPQTIGDLFSLTGSESRLVCALAMGRSIEETSQELGVTVETARTYLKRVFAKTGTRRQAELVSMVLASPTIFHQ